MPFTEHATGLSKQQSRGLRVGCRNNTQPARSQVSKQHLPPYKYSQPSKQRLLSVQTVETTVCTVTALVSKQHQGSQHSPVSKQHRLSSQPSKQRLAAVPAVRRGTSTLSAV